MLNLSKFEEEKVLEKVVTLLNEKIATMEQEIFQDAEKIQDFRRYMWENKNAMDKQELNAVRSDSESEAILLLQGREYFKKLLKIKDSPYFASIVIDDEEKNNKRFILG